MDRLPLYPSLYGECYSDCQDKKDTEEYLSNEWLTTPDQVRCMDGSAVEGCNPDEHCDCCDDEGGV